MQVSWQTLQEQVSQCISCPLCAHRTHTVFGEGNPHAFLLFVGEGPGADEDRMGRPFVGRAGQLLDKMIQAMGLQREDVYIANVVKCRPPGNRTPLPEEMQACLPYLRGQFALIRPKVIVCLGATAARAIISEDIRITRDRGNWVNKKGVWIMPTYHPAALLRDPTKKRETWQDLQEVMKKLEETDVQNAATE